MQSAAYADIAQTIADKYITGINEEIGNVWIESEGDISAVIDALQKIDTTDAESEILELQEAFRFLVESADELSGVAEAHRTVTMAIEGQLSAAQQFEEWAIQNVDAQNLFAQLMADSVTQSELESAVNAFHDLGIEGDDLNNVISALADAFSDAADELLNTITDIDDAQGNLIGASDDPQVYLDSLQSIVDFFSDTPSWGEIRGDEAVYKQAIADYVVTSEFQNLLGRDPGPASTYYQDALLSGELDIDDISDAILGGISEPEDVVSEIFNRLFGRTPDDPWWADQLRDNPDITIDNIEDSIYRGAAES